MKLRKHILGLGVAVALIVAGGAALAVQLSGLGHTYWSIKQDVTSTSTCIRSRESSTCSSKGCSTICALFPAGDGGDHHRKLAIIDGTGSSAAVRCCYVGTRGLDISASLQITNGGGENDAQGSCFEIGINGVKTKHLSYVASLENGAAGFVAGLCTTKLLIANEREIYWPCDEDADCTDIDTGAGTVSAGTCNTTPTAAQRAAAGMILNCQASGTVNVGFEKEWVQL